MDKKRIVLPLGCLIAISLIFGIVNFYKDKYDNMPTLNVLMLHMVTKDMPEDRSLDTLYITDNMLREYCEYFSNEYNIVSLDEAYDIIKNKKEVDNPNLLAFTFDDGYDNNYILAYPILKDLGIEANINIIAKYTDENYLGYLTWAQVKEMADSGLINIGSHTYDSHYYTLTSLGDERPVLSALLPGEDNVTRENRIFSDLELADNMISEIIGKDLSVLAYPYGVPPFDLVDNIKDKFGYNIQLMVRPGVNKTIDEFEELKRFTVNGRQKPELLERIMKRYKGLKFLNMLKAGELFS